MLSAIALGAASAAQLDCCFEGATFWDSLDDRLTAPSGREGTKGRNSKLPRLCLNAATSRYADCAADQPADLFLLDHPSRYVTWQHLVPMEAELNGKGPHTYGHLPRWSRRAEIPRLRRAHAPLPILDDPFRRRAGCGSSRRS